MKKRMLSLLLALVMILGLLPTVALGASVVEDRRGYAHLTVENTTFTDASAASNNQPPAWKGQKITAGFPVTEGMTMMDAIVKILKERNVSQTGAENGYISEIGGLKEFDNGQDSGWMGTLNGWFTNKGFQNYVIKPGDEIRIMYTSTGRGADLGGGPGKLHAMVAAIHADGNALVHSGRAFGADDIGKALGGPADDIDIHLMQAHLHGAPQAGGAELQRAVESALNLLVVICNGGQLCPLVCGDGIAAEPFQIFCFVVDHAIKSPFRFAMKVKNYPRRKWARR